MAVHEAVQLALTLIGCALLAALVLELHRARRARADETAALRDAIASVNEQQIAHRDALVDRISTVLNEVMNATAPRTVVIGPANDAPRPPGRPDLRVVPPPDEEPPEPEKR